MQSTKESWRAESHHQHDGDEWLSVGAWQMSRASAEEDIARCRAYFAERQVDGYSYRIAHRIVEILYEEPTA